ncbi:DUF202 domain-containing protein [Allgaiera indica]|uniref:DUF202 domain-containing protein n=1 Tax=Allgaiera indica TaxID=765699 RepID=UPI00136328E9|nr:DUF202 domain-containing protein [Allgaiera indica]
MDDKREDALRLQVEWAEERTALGIARTVASWARTGLGAIGVALGMHVVFRDPSQVMLGRLAATLFLLIAVALFIGGNVQARRLHRMLERERDIPIHNSYAPLTIALIVATTLCGVLLWTL